MPITGITKQDYQDWLENGGKIVVQISAADISSDLSFESFPLVKTHLYTGFELPPAPQMMLPSNLAALIVCGDVWARAVAFSYSHNGNIIYKKLPTGDYEAVATATM